MKLFPAVTAVVLVACSGQSTSNTNAPDAASAAQCTPMAQEAAQIDVVESDAAPEKSTGGTIALGTYVLTAARTHGTGKPAGTAILTARKDTIHFLPNRDYERILSDGANETTTSGSVVVKDTEVTIVIGCK